MSYLSALKDDSVSMNITDPPNPPLSLGSTAIIDIIMQNWVLPQPEGPATCCTIE